MDMLLEMFEKQYDYFKRSELFRNIILVLGFLQTKEGKTLKYKKWSVSHGLRKTKRNTFSSVPCFNFSFWTLRQFLQTFCYRLPFLWGPYLIISLTPIAICSPGHCPNIFHLSYFPYLYSHFSFLVLNKLCFSFKSTGLSIIKSIESS